MDRGAPEARSVFPMRDQIVRQADGRCRHRVPRDECIDGFIGYDVADGPFQNGVATGVGNQLRRIAGVGRAVDNPENQQRGQCHRCGNSEPGGRTNQPP